MYRKKPTGNYGNQETSLQFYFGCPSMGLNEVKDKQELPVVNGRYSKRSAMKLMQCTISDEKTVNPTHVHPITHRDTKNQTRKHFLLSQMC